MKLVELARAMLAEPEVLLLDEPVAGVNPTLAKKLKDQIRRLNDQGTTFLLIEHDMEFVMDLADPIVVLDQGHVLTEGTPEGPKRRSRYRRVPRRRHMSDDTTRPVGATDRADPVLSLSNVDSGYGEVQVLDDCSVRLDPGEIVCLVGPNGAGKSTVLKTAFGMLTPWTGTVMYHGRDIGGMAPEEIVREGIGYVPQTDNVFGSLTIDENLRMGGVARDGGLEAVIETLYDRFPIIEEKRTAKARTLSGGQRQVLAFARALVMEPDVLLIDEPSAGLAPNTADDVFEDVQEVNDMDTAILMVEQNA